MINGIWGMETPPVARFFHEKIKRFYAYGFLTLLLNFYSLTFKTNCQGSGGSRELSYDLFATGGKRQFVIFEVFRAYLNRFPILLQDIFFGSNTLLCSCDRHQRVDYKCCSYPGNKAQSRNVCHILKTFGVFKQSVLAQAYELRQWFFY